MLAKNRQNKKTPSASVSHYLVIFIKKSKRRSEKKKKIKQIEQKNRNCVTCASAINARDTRMIRLYFIYYCIASYENGAIIFICSNMSAYVHLRIGALLTNYIMQSVHFSINFTMCIAIKIDTFVKFVDCCEN